MYLRDEKQKILKSNFSFLDIWIYMMFFFKSNLLFRKSALIHNPAPFFTGLGLSTKTRALKKLKRQRQNPPTPPLPLSLDQGCPLYSSDRVPPFRRSRFQLFWCSSFDAMDQLVFTCIAAGVSDKMECYDTCLAGLRI